jgi:putative peptide zinc metalloprotease protein
MSASKTDLMYEIEYNPNFLPARSAKVNVKTMIVDGKPQYIMKNHSTGAYYDLDALSNDIWNLIDGKRNLSEITDEILEKWKEKDESADADTVKEVVSFFAESDCLRAQHELVRKKRVRLVSAFEIDVSLIENSKASLRRIYKTIRPLFKSPLLWVTLGFIGINSIAFSGRFASIFADSANFEILGSTVVGFFFYSFVVLGPAIIIHELAHAITLVHYGGTPGEIGTGLFYFGPMFYVDATDSWMLLRRQRVMVMMAGSISTLLIASIIVTWGFLVPFPSSVSTIMYMAAFFCFYSTLMNLAPPFETDGYYVLTDLLNMPNLREDAYNYLKTGIKKALRRPTEEIKNLTTRKKRIFLGYAVLSGAWIVYTAYQTFIFTFYMARDAGASFVNVASAVLFAQTLSLAAVAISVASVLYFGMTVAGYGVIFATAIKKSFKKTLKLESIHDRDLSVFLYLPTQVSIRVAGELNNNLRRQAQKLSHNYRVKSVSGLNSVVLRMGATQLAITQIKEHMKNIELKFYSIYKEFLQKHSNEILESVGMYSPKKRHMTNLLKDMANEIAVTGTSEAKNIVSQIIEREKRATLYLLNSAFSSVWTIELPPAQQQAVLDTLLPTMFSEDLAITDLYDEVEDFKKNTIYGIDTLAKFSRQSQRFLDKALSHPESYQVFSFFEPVKSRLAFVGRTEQIEKDIQTFGFVFVNQTWCGYLDSLLNETNLTLSTLEKVPSIKKEDVLELSNGELFVLQKNLAGVAANERTATASLLKCEKCMPLVVQNIAHLKNQLTPNQNAPTDMLDSFFAINAENLKHLPNRVETLKEKLQQLYTQVNRIEKMAQTEYEKRKPTIAKRKRRMLLAYAPVAILAAMLAVAGFMLITSFAGIALVIAAAFLNSIYGIVCYSRWKSFHTVRKYPSPAFSRTQLFLFALAQTMHKYLATSDVLTPAETESDT